MSSLQSRIVLAPIPITAETAREAAITLAVFAPDLLKMVNPAAAVYPPIADPAKRTAKPRFER